MKKKQENKVTAETPPTTSKLSQLKQTDGQLEKQPRTLSQFFGETVQCKYHTTDTNEYELFLKGMNKTDLHRHAIKCGLAPKDDRNRLITSLIREFKRVVASYKPLPIVKSNDKKIPKDLVDFLAGGR